MAKLEGFKRVAVVEQCGRDYFFAIYDDGYDYKVLDSVVVSGDSTIKTIKDIVSVEEAKERFTKNITAEVICPVYVDRTSYEKRVRDRKRAAEILKLMDKKNHGNSRERQI